MKEEIKICKYCGGKITRLILHLSCKELHNMEKETTIDTKDITFNKLSNTLINKK